MNPAPKWFKPVAITALLWNVLGCVAYLSDVTLSPEKLAQMTAAQQAMYAARPAWSVGGTAIAVWFGALGCLGLVVRKRWANPLLQLSLLGVIVQDIGIFGFANAASAAGAVGIVLQGLVLVVAIALVMFGRNAVKQGWIG